MAHNLLEEKKKYGQVLNPRKNKYVIWAEMFNWAGVYRRDFLASRNFGSIVSGFAFAQRVIFVHESFYRYRKDNSNASIQNKKKVFYMCDEYDFAKEKVMEHLEIWQDVYYEYLGKQYGA